MTLVTNIMLKKIVYISILCMRCIVLQQQRWAERDLNPRSRNYEFPALTSKLSAQYECPALTTELCAREYLAIICIKTISFIINCILLTTYNNIRCFIN